MHTLISISKSEHRENMEKIVVDAADKYNKACYISFNDPYSIVVQMLDNMNVGQDKFIIIDVSGDVKEYRAVNKTTHIVPIKSLFNVYLFMRDLIKDEGIDLLLIDSLSVLIYRYNDLPLKQMLTDLLLEVGAFRCDSSIVVFNEHLNHEVIEHLDPLIGKRLIL